MRRGSGQRAWIAWGVVVSLIGGAVVVGGAYAGWSFGLGTHDRATLVGAALGLDAVLFAVVAAVLALAAYWASSGQPDLGVEITYSFSSGMEGGVLVAGDGDVDAPSFRWIGAGRMMGASVELLNRSQYSARNPGMRIRFVGLEMPTVPEGWRSTRSDKHVGVTEIQWDGGVDNIIHGNWSRQMPHIDFGDAAVLPAVAPHLVITVVADGVSPRQLRAPLQTLDEAGYANGAGRAAEELGGHEQTSDP